MRVWASSATLAKVSRSQPGSSHGSQWAMKLERGSARMYSPLNARSFFSSKKAFEEMTSSRRNSGTISDHGMISRSPPGPQPSSIR